MLFSKYNKFIIVSGIILTALAFLDKKLTASLILVVFLAALSLFFINKIKNEKKRKIITILFLISFALHILAVLFIFYGSFQPFSDGRGDYLEYNLTAVKVSSRLSENDFSIEGLPLGHYYALFSGYLYFLTVPKMLVAELFNAWLVALTVVIAYLIAKQIGASDKAAFLTGIIVSIYPSLAFFGSLMLKEAFVVFFSTLAVLLSLMLLKRFSWKIFGLFYIALMGLTHFRFYVALPLIFVFVVSFLLFSEFKIKKRLITATIAIFLMGFLPMIVMVNGSEQGYFAINAVLRQLNFKTITYYRDVAYNFRVDSETGEYKEVIEKTAGQENPPEKPEAKKPGIDVEKIIEQTPEGVPIPDIVSNKDWGQDSSINIGTGSGFFGFIKNTSLSFAYALLGPFPWQLRSLKHLFILPEILLWWACLFFAVKGIIKSFKKEYKSILPLLVFGLGLIAIVSLYMTNFGLVTRIRIPAFVALFCLASLGFSSLNNIKIPLLNKIFTS